MTIAGVSVVEAVAVTAWAVLTLTLVGGFIRAVVQKNDNDGLNCVVGIGCMLLVAWFVGWLK